MFRFLIPMALRRWQMRFLLLPVRMYDTDGNASMIWFESVYCRYSRSGRRWLVDGRKDGVTAKG